MCFVAKSAPTVSSRLPSTIAQAVTSKPVALHRLGTRNRGARVFRNNYAFKVKVH